MAGESESSQQQSEHQDDFRLRMQDQCEEIEHYRLVALKAQGRRLSMDEAGLEWIERHAEAFARGDYESPE